MGIPRAKWLEYLQIWAASVQKRLFTPCEDNNLNKSRGSAIAGVVTSMVVPESHRGRVAFHLILDQEKYLNSLLQEALAFGHITHAESPEDNTTQHLPTGNSIAFMINVQATIGLANIRLLSVSTAIYRSHLLPFFLPPPHRSISFYNQC